MPDDRWTGFAAAKSHDTGGGDLAKRSETLVHKKGPEQLLTPERAQALAGYLRDFRAGKSFADYSPQQVTEFNDLLDRLTQASSSSK